jgi:hypothetical protein
MMQAWDMISQGFEIDDSTTIIVDIPLPDAIFF